MGCGLCNCDHGLTPICIPSVNFQPYAIQCPQVSSTPIENPLCDLFPEIDSLAGFFANLPFLMLYVVSLPARFLYCMAYEFLVNADSFIDFLIYYLLYPFIDFVTAPFLYFVLGFNNGVNDNFSLPTTAYGFLNACFINQFLEKVYTAFGDFFYVIGFIIGFFTSIFYKLYNTFIDIVCTLVFWQLCIGIEACVGFTVPVINKQVAVSGCAIQCIQPFGFLQGLVCQFLNCDCALGSCPTVSLIIPIVIGSCTPSCNVNGNNSTPNCPSQNLTNITQIQPQTFNQPPINPIPPPSPTQSESESGVPPSEVTQSESETIPSESETPPSEVTPSESEVPPPPSPSESEIPPPSPSPSESEVPPPPPSPPPPITSPCDAVNYLYYCNECVSEHVNCDLCIDVLDVLEQYGCIFSCCSEACLISNACYRCIRYPVHYRLHNFH